MGQGISTASAEPFGTIKTLCSNYTFCSVLALNFYMTTSSRQSETNSLKICITQLQTSGEAKSWNQNKAEHVNPAVLVMQNKVKMQMSFEHTMFLSLGPQFILYFSLPCGNILKKAGHIILNTHFLVIDLEVKGISVCSCPSWPENPTSFSKTEYHKSASNNCTVKIQYLTLFLFCTCTCFRQANKGSTLNLQWHYGKVKP